MADSNKGNVETSTVSERKQRRQEWWKKKRRQTGHNDANDEQPKKKRREFKQVKNNKEEEMPQETDIETSGRSRFILFIGNLSFECTEDDIRDHFDFDGGISDVRILTNKTTGKSKGCAFLEFRSRKIQTKALKLHHSTLCGRRINVEVTCGGGGKGEQRMTKLKSKIDKMKEKRKKAKLKKKQLRQTTTSGS